MITIYFNVEWNEFQVKVKSRPAATYHTDCPEDAVDTARDMARRNSGPVTVDRTAKKLLKGIKI